jgi:hypothetical protein
MARCAPVAAGCSCAGGLPSEELAELARAARADAVHFSADVSPFARRRRRQVTAALEAEGWRSTRTPS